MKKKKHRRGRLVLKLLAMLILVGVLVFFLFQTREVQVKGNEYYGDSSMKSWIQNDKYAVNTLYIFAKYNYTDVALPSAVESVKISLKNPWTVVATVTEKQMYGYVQISDEERLYFDQNGMAALQTKKEIDGVPLIEGLELDTTKVKMGKTLPVSDKSIFKKIVEAAKYLNKYQLTPDRLVCGTDGKSLVLYFGKVQVLIGESSYEERLAQISPILAALQEKDADAEGILHLENYEEGSSSIRFVPKQAGTSGQKSGDGSGDASGDGAGDESGDESGNESGDTSADESGSASEDNSADNSGDGTADDSGDASVEE